MSLRLATSQPKSLLSAIKLAIDKKHVTTWSYDMDGDFTHTPDQWKNKAWLRPHILNGELLLTTLPPKGVALTWEVYAVYTGRFAEMAIAHVHDLFSNARASAAPSDGDLTG